jgi:hypothetical protein
MVMIGAMKRPTNGWQKLSSVLARLATRYDTDLAAVTKHRSPDSDVAPAMESLDSPRPGDRTERGAGAAEGSEAAPANARTQGMGGGAYHSELNTASVSTTTTAKAADVAMRVKLASPQQSARSGCDGGLS